MGKNTAHEYGIEIILNTVRIHFNQRLVSKRTEAEHIRKEKEGEVWKKTVEKAKSRK